MVKSIYLKKYTSNKLNGERLTVFLEQDKNANFCHFYLTLSINSRQANKEKRNKGHPTWKERKKIISISGRHDFI